MNDRIYHFIAGLPRSGSTLLSSILKQNPRFHAGVTSPTLSLVTAILPRMGGQSEFATFYTDDRRRAVLRSLFDGYYASVTNPVIFDTNRTWTARLPLLLDLYPTARIICAVRDVGWVLDSVERMIRRNPLQTPRGVNFNAGQTIYSRAETLMNSETGLVGLAWSSLRDAWFGEQAARLLLIEYDALVANPERILRSLYQELSEPWYSHDFDAVAHDEKEYDATLGMPGLHAVRPSVSREVRPPCIPPDIFQKYSDANFWRRLEGNPRRVRVLA